MDGAGRDSSIRQLPYTSRGAQLISQLGDTSLPEEQPAELTEEQLKALHHVLLEVSCSLCGLS